MSDDARARIARRIDDLFTSARPQGKQWTNAEVVTELKRASPDLKVGAVYLSQLRNGKRTNPSRELLTALARFFGVSTAYFLDDEVGESVQAELAALHAMRNAGVRAVAMRAAGMRADNLQAITAIMDQYRQMQGLPAITEEQ